MFTILFLVCNLPLFINLMHNMTTRFFGVDYPGVYFGTRFMFWYGWHIARMESVVLNAALNPVLYYCRMRRFRSWCNLVLTCKSLKPETGFTQMQASRTNTTGIRMVRTPVSAVKHSRLEVQHEQNGMESPCPGLRETGLSVPSVAISDNSVCYS